MADVDETLETRGSSHGCFITNGGVMQRLKNTCRAEPGWSKLNPYQAEALDMICHKMGRILSGDPSFVDHWHDIAGYAKLVENILTTGKSNP